MKETQRKWLRGMRLLAMHLLPLGAIVTGVKLWYLWWLIPLLFGRLLFVTAGYHRYFSHKSFKLDRVTQFIFAFLAMTSIQKGVL